ncbi:MAG: ribonuclease [Myxococcales bacterium]|nr:ribonuclease [Myxococcales bacterium]
MATNAARPRSVAKEFIHEFIDSFSRNQPLDLAAQLAYFALLSLFPFAMFLLTVVGYVPLHGLDEHIMRAIYSVMPPDAAKLCEQTLHEIIGKQRGGLLLLTLVFAIWSASGGASGLITALNRAYDVAETRPAWRVKLRAIGLTVAGVVAIIIATAAMLIGPSIVHAIWAFFGLGGAFDEIWSVARWPVAVLAMMTMVACIYYFAPNVKQKWRFITPGSVVAVVAWLGASIGFRIYVSHFGSYAKTYGALGTVIVLMVWLYISGLMIILGGEINAILDRLHHIQHTEAEPGPITIPDPHPTEPDNRPPAQSSIHPA